RDPAADHGARARPLRPGLPLARDPQHGAVQPGGVRQARGRAARLGDLPGPDGAARGAAAPTGPAQAPTGTPSATGAEPHRPAGAAAPGRPTGVAPPAAS